MIYKFIVGILFNFLALLYVSNDNGDSYSPGNIFSK